MKEIDNAFDGEAERHINEQHAAEQVARDMVVLRYLKEGDTRALAHWLVTDYNPGKDVRRLLSRMFQPDRYDPVDIRQKSDAGIDEVPYGLRTFSRDGKKGPPRDPEAAERNQAIKDCYDQLMERNGPGGHESAIHELEDLLGPEIKGSAIREAVKLRSPKSKS